MTSAPGQTRQARMQKILEGAFAPLFLLLENESQNHSVPKGSETHFKLVMVSEKFAGLGRVARQQLVYKLFEFELANGLHALTMRLLASSEEASRELVSPECLGGAKGDKES